ncbi:TPA: GyrI-like domain-containing protein [Streptococcus agalactiae]
MLSFQIVEKPAMILAGVTLENVKSNQECPKLWEKLHKQYNPSNLKEKGIQQAIGICKTQPDFRFDYSATYRVETSVQAPKGLEIIRIPSATYAVISVKGPMPSSLQETWRKIIQGFFQENNLKPANSPNLEIYSSQHPQDTDYQMEIWLAIADITNKSKTNLI